MKKAFSIISNDVTHFHINICQSVLAPAAMELFYEGETK